VLLGTFGENMSCLLLTLHEHERILMARLVSSITRMSLLTHARPRFVFSPSLFQCLMCSLQLPGIAVQKKLQTAANSSALTIQLGCSAEHCQKVLQLITCHARIPLQWGMQLHPPRFALHMVRARQTTQRPHNLGYCWVAATDVIF
jgi:hypothetical protein